MPNLDKSAARARLAESLGRRLPTWSVAEAVLALEVAPKGSELERELAGLAKSPNWYDEMSGDFDRVDPADSQLKTFAELFPVLYVEGLDAGDPEQLKYLARRGLDVLGAGEYPSAGAALRDFRAIELNEGMMVTTPKALRKRLRFLRDFEDKTARLEDGLRLRRAQMQAKSRLAYAVDAEACDDLTLSFCAYLASRANRRSMFTVGEQSRAQDTISAALEELLKESPTTNWAQVALVKPTKKVIEQLAPEARGELIGRFHAALADSAAALEDLYPHLPERMHKEMVMVKGVDSSRWNAYAGALNTMRSAWISAVLAADLPEVLERYLPGKAPRLMASDLVHWHRAEGKELHEDTRLFNALPFPWEVVSGKVMLDRETVERAASAAGVDAVSTGWVGPRTNVALERPEAEPALVHGVVVSDPQLAKNLRRCGVFSAKGLKYLDELPMLLARDTLVDEKGQKTPVVLGAVDVPLPFYALDEDTEHGPERDEDVSIGI